MRAILLPPQICVNKDHHTYVMTFLPISVGAAKSGCSIGKILAKGERRAVVLPIRQEGRDFAYDVAQDRTGRASLDAEQVGDGVDEAENQAQRHLSGRVLKPPIPGAREMRQTLDNHSFHAGYLTCCAGFSAALRVVRLFTKLSARLRSRREDGQ
jgi:hypothetical protein